jgi:hypothetical protein
MDPSVFDFFSFLQLDSFLVREKDLLQRFRGNQVSKPTGWANYQIVGPGKDKNG